MSLAEKQALALRDLAVMVAKAKGYPPAGRARAEGEGENDAKPKLAFGHRHLSFRRPNCPHSCRCAGGLKTKGNQDRSKALLSF
jgi:hypothetical protein